MEIGIDGMGGDGRALHRAEKAERPPECAGDRSLIVLPRAVSLELRE